MNWWKKTKRTYLDYAAATPVRKEVLKAMQPYWQGHFGNAGAIHAEGVTAAAAVKEARESVARTLRVRATDITFTSGGTESNNLLILGMAEALRQAGIKYEDIEIISTKLEHPSIASVLNHLEAKGCRVLYAPVTPAGEVIVAELEKLLSPRTRLVTLAHANSETGVVTDLNKISRVVKGYAKQQGITICFHSDASQTPLWLPVALDTLGVDALTLDAGKFGGPKGSGALVHRRGVSIKPLLFGGQQESGLRPGTENVSQVVGLALALELAQNGYEKRSARVERLRDWLIAKLEKLPNVILNGSRDSRLPNNVNVSLVGFDTEYAVIVLDAAGIAASTKSACSGHSGAASEVVLAMTGDINRANSTLRFTLGESTTKSELRKVVAEVTRFTNQSILPEV